MYMYFTQLNHIISFPLRKKKTLVKGYQVIVSKGNLSEFVQILNNCSNYILLMIFDSPWNLHTLEMIATSCYQNWPTCDGSLDLAIMGPHPLQGVAEIVTTQLNLLLSTHQILKRSSYQPAERVCLGKSKVYLANGLILQMSNLVTD